MAIDWKSIRQEFEEHGATYRGLAKKYSCNYSTIRGRAIREGWARHKDDSAVEKGQSEPESLADEHKTLWKDVRRRLVKGLKSSDAKAGLEELKVAKIAGEVLSSVIKGERSAWGLEGRELCMDDEKDIAAQMAYVTAVQGADEALDRE